MVSHQNVHKAILIYIKCCFKQKGTKSLKICYFIKKLYGIKKGADTIHL